MEASSRDTELRDEVKWFIQRGTRGWAYCDVWRLNYYLSEVIRETVDVLAKYQQPPGDMSREEWYCILRDIRMGFEAFEKLEAMEYNTDSGPNLELKRQREEEFSRGIELLGKYFFHLWC